jgi:CRP/FNR family transcriptional regulator, anaerobic regulatory protein
MINIFINPKVKPMQKGGFDSDQNRKLNDNGALDARQVIRVLNLISPLSTALRECIQGYLKPERLPRKHHLLSEGQTSNRIYFIQEGCARAYYFDLDGREHTCWFMGSLDIMISVYSFFTQLPSSENIELLEDSILLSVTWDELQSIYADHPEFNFHGRIISQKYYIQAEERAIILRTKSPAERYQLLLKTYPNILQKASLGQIASFLCITQETLSRIRARRRI